MTIALADSVRDDERALISALSGELHGYALKNRIKWEDYMTVNTSFAVDSVVFSDEFRHSKFVAYRVKDAIADYFNEKYGKRPTVRLNNPDLIFHIHIAGEECTLAFDSSGESLHRRGYRVETGAAPINEVLAAGMILLTGWNGECDFIDPMCGSGTVSYTHLTLPTILRV